MAPGFWTAAFGVALAAAAPAMADEAPKYGGTLTYMIPADSPPSFDAQREETYATIHSAASPPGSCRSVYRHISAPRRPSPALPPRARRPSQPPRTLVPSLASCSVRPCRPAYTFIV